MEYCQQAIRVEPLHSLQDERAVSLTNETTGKSLKIRIAQREIGHLFERTVVIRDEEEAVLQPKLIEERTAGQEKRGSLTVSKQSRS